MPFSERRRVPTNGIELDVGFAGPERGPPLLLLHGFPDTARSCWFRQVPALAAAGWRVIAPDQRGYARSDKPAGLAAYRLDMLVDDAVGLLGALGHARATWAGHDWGGAVTWWAAQHRAHAVRRFVVFNCPHPNTLGRHLLTDPAQMARSWYIAAFQVPGVPEWVLARNGFRALEQSLLRNIRRGTLPPEELEALRAVWAAPGALTGMLAWYRAGRALLARADDTQIDPPALLVWGRRDAALGPALAEESIARCRQGRLVWFDRAGHWVHRDEPESVGALLGDFLEISAV